MNDNYKNDDVVIETLTDAGLTTETAQTVLSTLRDAGFIDYRVVSEQAVGA